MKQLPEAYYQHKDVLWLAQDLLGKVIVSDIGGLRTEAIITETEAYRAPEDKASHAHGDKRTKRTEIMFGPAGQSYVYLCYGIHNLCNVVTGPIDVAHAVLIRAVEPIKGIEIMRSRRAIKGPDISLTNGPGKWTMAMGVTTKHNNLSYYEEQSEVRIYQVDLQDHLRVVSGPRVGVGYAAECALWPWRYYIKDNKWVSKPLHVTYPDIDT